MEQTDGRNNTILGPPYIRHQYAVCWTIKAEFVRVAVIDYGLGNIGSVTNALEHLGYSHVRLTDCDTMQPGCNAFLLPGVGSYPEGMRLLKERGLDVVIRSLINDGIPGMGICLGMQLLAEWSLEGGKKVEGLGYFRGGFKCLDSQDDVVPHTGWSSTCSTGCCNRWESLLNTDFYYVHSYATAIGSPDQIATCWHGTTPFTAALNRGKLLGVQFHPEKSQESGLRLMQTFFKEAVEE